MLRGSNKEVVIKVLKPGVEDILSTDLSFLYLASRVLEFLNPELERTSMAAIVGDIRASMLDEAREPCHMDCPVYDSALCTHLWALGAQGVYPVLQTAMCKAVVE